MKNTLETFRLRNSLSFAEMARRAGMASRSTVFQHCTGDRRISAESALRYHRIFGFPLSELRPDLWPPEETTHAPEQESAQSPAVSRAAAPAVPA